MRFAPHISGMFAVAALAVSAPALADHHGSAPSLDEVLASDARGTDGARDQYRRPAETLAFFQVEPTMTVVEYGPGGGWYTRVLAPYISGPGTYMATQQDSDGRTYRSRRQEAGVKGWTERFSEAVREMGHFGEEEVIAFESDEVPEGVAGNVDRVLIFRSIHGLLNGEVADTELRRIRALLSDDGMVGVVQHRAPEDHSYEMTTGTRAYLRQSDVIALFEQNGFELADSSEINANPADPADHARGVWELPPVLAGDPANRDAMMAIGESDRMTLLFRKRD